MSTRRTPRELSEALTHIANLGVNPKTVIDVGAAWGTPELLKAFPNAYHILIDPLPMYSTRLNTLLKKYSGEYHQLALSDQKATLSMVDDGVGASISSNEASNTITVQATTLDSLFKDRDLPEPIFLKTDCQGYDMHVMRGGKNFIKKVAFTLNEVNMFHPTNNHELPDFGDTIMTMKELGFGAYDIVSYQTRPFDNALGYVDIIFANELGSLRAKHQWR